MSDIDNTPDDLLPDSVSTLNVVSSMSLSATKDITGSSETTVALDQAKHNQLDNVDVETGNNQLKINGPSARVRNYKLSGKIRIRSGDISGTRLFVRILVNGSVATSSSNDVFHDFQDFLLPTVTLPLSNGDTISIEVEAAGAASTDTYSIVSGDARTYLEAVQK